MRPDPAAALLDAARRARCRDAEVYTKTVQVRQVTSEPRAVPGGPAHRIVSRHAESGTALRLLDVEGREGFAWCGGGADDATDAEAMLREAIESARLGGRAGAAWPAEPEAAAHQGVPAIEGLVDPEALERPDDALAAPAAAAIREVAARAGGVLEVDRVVVTEAKTSVRLARISGASVAFERTLAAISVAVVPAVEEAGAVVEERSACFLRDLDPIAAARAAVDRALPRRPASVPGSIGVASASARGAGHPPALAVPASLVLAPRAAATLWASLAPLLEAGAIGANRPSMLEVAADGRMPGRPSSAPVDGAGRPAVRVTLMESGRAVGRVDAVAGPFVRSSYRDLPAPGAAALTIAPGRGAGLSEGTLAAGGFVLRATAIEVRTGPAAWSIEIRRGDWCRIHEAAGPTVEPASLGAADGIAWEGPPAAIVQAVVATLDDPEWFEVGLPVATPSVVLDGLGPWRLPEPAE